MRRKHLNTYWHQAGFTMMELLLTLGLVATMTSLATAVFDSWLPRQRSISAMYTFKNLFQFARYNAVQQQQAVRVCALTSANACTRDWSHDVRIAVFLDNNRNQKLDAGDVTLREINWVSNQGDIRWKASLARRYIEFLPGGNTWQNGTLYYCPRNSDIRFARALVLNHGGRGYQPGDTNGDGIHENRTYEALSCPL